MATIDDFGGTADPLSDPPLGGPSGWAAAVRDAITALQNSGGGGGGDGVAVVADPANFPGIDPTGASDSSAGLRSWANAIPAGGIGLVPGGTYRMDSTVNIPDKSLEITAHGALFLANSINPCFSIVGTFGTQYTVNSITPSLSTAYSQAGEAIWVTTLVLSSAPGWAVGDLVKVGADNILAWSGSARAGQSFTVIGVSGSTITCIGTPRYSMTAGVRVAKYSTSLVRWVGGGFGVTAAILNGSTQMPYGVFEVKRLANPQFDGLVFKSAAGPAMSLTGCYAATIRDVVCDYAKNTGGMYGYGINDQKSEYTVVRNLQARYVRHAYTTNSSNNSNGSNVGETGPVFGAVVNGVCVGASQTSWDCHGDADAVTFLDCHSIDSYGAFMLRGVNGRVVNAYVKGKHPGNVVSAEIISSAAQVYGAHIDGLVADGVQLDGANGANAAMFNIKSDVMQTTPTVIENVEAKNCTLLYFINSDKQTVHVKNMKTNSGTLRTANGGVIIPIPETPPPKYLRPAIWSGTQAEYDALTPDATTLYVVI